MTSPRVVVLSVAALTPAMIGPYGTSYVQTKRLNRLASRGLVCDRFIADSGHDSLILGSMWNGRHVLRSRTSPTEHGLLAQLAKHQKESVFISDAPVLALGAADAGFNGVQILGDLQEALAVDAEDTRMARLLAMGMQQLQDSPAVDLLWLHLNSLAACWDAPLDFRGAWAEDEGPQPLNDWQPVTTHNPAIDPDELLSYVYTYADQVALLDSLLEPIMESVTNDQRTMFILAGTSGMSLGTHGWIGPNAGPLLSPRTHLPLILHLPNSNPCRSRSICQPAMLAPTIGEFLLGENWEDIDTGETMLHQLLPSLWAKDLATETLAATIEHDEVSLQTADWHWYQRQSGVKHLFRKPDDRWDMNDVIARAEGVANLFESSQAKIVEAITQGVSPALELDQIG